MSETPQTNDILLKFSDISFKPTTYYTCADCDETPKIIFNDKSEPEFQCIKGHKNPLSTNNTSEIFEKMTKENIDNLTCSKCSNSEISTAYYSTEDNKIFCEKCNADNDENLIPFEMKYSYCFKHNKEYQNYCYDHKINCCFLCSKEHKKCNLISLAVILPEDENLEQLKEELKNKKELIAIKEDEFKEYVIKITEQFNNWKINISASISLLETMINTYMKIQTNFNITQNINFLIKNNGLFDVNFEIERQKKYDEIDKNLLNEKEDFNENFNDNFYKNNLKEVEYFNPEKESKMKSKDKDYENISKEIEKVRKNIANKMDKIDGNDFENKIDSSYKKKNKEIMKQSIKQKIKDYNSNKTDSGTGNKFEEITGDKIELMRKHYNLKKEDFPDKLIYEKLQKANGNEKTAINLILSS